MKHLIKNSKKFKKIQKSTPTKQVCVVPLSKHVFTWESHEGVTCDCMTWEKNFEKNFFSKIHLFTLFYNAYSYKFGLKIDESLNYKD